MCGKSMAELRASETVTRALVAGQPPRRSTRMASSARGPSKPLGPSGGSKYA